MIHQERGSFFVYLHEGEPELQEARQKGLQIDRVQHTPTYKCRGPRAEVQLLELRRELRRSLKGARP